MSLSFQALNLANAQRSAYGLRYNDYARYRKHCANRTHRLRSSLKITHGKGREYKKTPPIAPDNFKDGHLQLLLFEAERAWAFSQELSAQAALPANKANAGTLRHSATGRFRRAVHWSTQLLSHCQTLHASGRLSVEGLLQATIYTLILNGRFLRFRDEFDDALVQLSVARSLLDELSAAAPTSRDQALAVFFADDVGPEIRYCAHELGRAKAYDVDGIVRDVAGAHKNEIVEGYEKLVGQLRTQGVSGSKGEGRKKLKVFLWEDEPVPIRNPELVDVLLRVQEAEARLKLDQGNEVKVKGKGDEQKAGGEKSKRGVAAYDAILSALSDAEDVARKLAEAQKAAGGTAGTSAAGTRDLQFVYAFILYQLLSRRVERDLLLVTALLTSNHNDGPRRATTKSGKAPVLKPSQPPQVDARLYPAVVKLLDTILQSLEQMRTLSVVDESPDLASAVEARLSFTKARRCLFLARSYAAPKRFAEALSLIQHAGIHLREARAVLSTMDADPIGTGASTTPRSFYPLSEDACAALEAALAADGARAKKDWLAHNGGSATADPRAYKKPLFFDIALNYVQLDMGRLEARAGKAPPPAAASAQDPTARRQQQQVASVPEKKALPRAKVEEELRAPTPEPEAAGRGGLSNLLGGWWGRK